ncbi:MAG: hypothetical protein ACTHN2_17220, partial [Nitrobacter sp.]
MLAEQLGLLFRRFMSAPAMAFFFHLAHPHRHLCWPKRKDRDGLQNRFASVGHRHHSGKGLAKDPADMDGDYGTVPRNPRTAARYLTTSRHEEINGAHRFSHVAMMTFCVRIIGNVIKS